jgi:hypothetical protein
MDVSNIIELICTIPALVGILFVARQVQLARAQIEDGRKQRQDETERMRRQGTLEYARQTLDTRHKAWDQLPDDYNEDEIKRFIEKCKKRRNTAEREAALGYLNLLETFCIGIDLEIYDAETAFRLYGERIIRVNKYYAPLIDWRISQSGNDGVYKDLKKGAAEFNKIKCKSQKELPKSS